MFVVKLLGKLITAILGERLATKIKAGLHIFVAILALVSFGKLNG